MIINYDYDKLLFIIKRPFTVKMIHQKYLCLSSSITSFVTKKGVCWDLNKVLALNVAKAEFNSESCSIVHI